MALITEGWGGRQDKGGREGGRESRWEGEREDREGGWEGRKGRERFSC